MSHFTKKWPIILLGAIMIVAGACLPAIRQAPSSRMPTAAMVSLAANEQIAGEIMAYLIEVVLGLAGAPGKRPAWSTRGLDLPLDFDMVNRRMFGPVPLRAELMVLDTNILGLSQVLYHYDRRLNLFKGRRDHDSLYPCSELMAIRLLLLHKLHNNETVSMAAIQQHAALFEPGSRDAFETEMAAMGLSDTEFRFLKAVFQSEPAFLRYMRHPFIVSTLRKIGVAEPDAFTLSADLMATYDQLSPKSQEEPSNRAATVAIVPAMLPWSDAPHTENSEGPGADTVQLIAEIRNSIQKKMHQRYPVAPTDGRLFFFSPRRPVTIHPGNAERVIGQLCPGSGFTIILLGKNVYRSLFIDPEADIYPHKKWIYLDVDDVRYGQIDAEIETVVSAIMPAIIAAKPPIPKS